jgi:sulfur-oxidizing protein SoxY
MTIRTNEHDGPSRRDMLKGAATLALGGTAELTITRPTQAMPATMKDAIAQATGGATVKPGRVKLDIPPLVENGNTVPCTVTVESSMTAADHVKTIHVFSEKNPQPNVISAHLGLRAGRAVVSTRIRLADTQTVMAVAEMSDGSFWSDRIDVLITLGACLEDS